MNEFGTNRNASGVSAGRLLLLMLLSILLGAGAVLALLTSGLTKYSIVASRDAKKTELLSELITNIDKYYYFRDQAPTDEKLVDTAAHALVNAVGDPYGAYYSEEEFEEFRNSLNGNYKGIGVLISEAPEYGAKVERVYEGNPAADAGVESGDYITAVDGVPVAGLPIAEISDRIGGEDGTTVDLTVLRGEETLYFTVTRGDVQVRRVYTELLESDIGYIRIESFTGSATSEFSSAVNELTSAGIRALIIDVRGNPGGALDTVAAIADRVLGECTVTTLTGKLVDPPKVYKSTAEKSIDLPIVVLTNGDSASASEIFAAAIQDNHAGTILGTLTFGKGIVQTSWEVLPGQGYIKLTTDVYLTPNGKMIHGVGVTPDIIVEQDPELEDMDVYFIRRDMPERDLQVNAAIALLKEKLN